MSKNQKDSNLYEVTQRAFTAVCLSDYTEKDLITEVLDTVSSDDFRNPIYKSVFEAVLSLLSKENTVLSPYWVYDEMRHLGTASYVDGLDFLEELRQEGEQRSLDAPIHLYARALRDFATKIRTKDNIKEALNSFEFSSKETAADAITSLSSSLNERLSEVSLGDEVSEMSSLIDTYMDTLEELSKIDDDIRGIPTYLPTLDKYTKGWKPGQVIVVAAQTGIGKSVFAVNCGSAAALAGYSVLMFSLEMKEEEVQRRIISSVSSVPQNDLKSGKLTNEQAGLVKEALESFKDKSFGIDAQLSTSLGAIKAKIQKRSQSKDGLDMVIIDYLALITSEGIKAQGEREKLEAITRELKLMSVEYSIPIMLVAQLRRPNNKEESSELPSVYELRGSGSIAADADVVVLIHRDKTIDGEVPNTKVILEKNRDGESNKIITCYSNLACSIFTEISREDTSSDNGSNGESYGELPEGVGSDDSSDNIWDDLDPEEYDSFDF